MMGEIEIEEYIHKPKNGGIRVEDYRLTEATLVFEKKVVRDDQGDILYLDRHGSVVATVKRDHTATYVYGTAATGGCRWHLVKRENLKNSGLFKAYY